MSSIEERLNRLEKLVEILCLNCSQPIQIAESVHYPPCKNLEQNVESVNLPSSDISVLDLLRH